MKRNRVLLISLLTLSGCSVDNINPNANSSKSESMIDESSVVASTSAYDAESSSIEIVSDFEITTDIENGYSVNNNIYTITKAGDYYLSGNLHEGEIYVEASENDEVKLILNNCKISNSTNSPIFVKEADKVVIKAEANSYNEIDDTRDSSTVEANSEDETIGKGAIYAKCDLNISGSGNLVVNTSYNNGIHTTKDLKIKNVNLKSTAINNSLKGNDSVEIESGNIIAISSGGDGIKTDDSDISTKGNQRGIVTISGGNIDIYAACDGIDASYDAIISDNANINIYTDSYSSYTKDVVSKSENEMYIAVSSTYYSTNYRYALYFYNDDIENGKWVNATYYKSMQQSMSRPGQMGSTTYYYKIDYSSNYTNFKLFRFTSSSENSLETYNACVSGTINTYYDTIMISSIYSSTIQAGWTKFQSNTGGIGMGPQGMDEGNSNKTDYSAKGIKADNQISIIGGNIFIKSSDDGIHANNDNALENSVDPLGNVTISGGNISIYTQDDGIHADNILSIEGGTIKVTNAYEGIEGNTIKISGGSTTIYATDDGVNAAGDKVTPSITISGGLVDITVGSGDVDGIDSNGTYTQSGGVVITRGASGSSSTGGRGGFGGGGGAMASGLDCDGTAKLTGGTLITLGATETTPQTSFCKATYSSTISKGTYKLDELDISFVAEYSYSGIYIYSEKLTVGNTYTISGTINKSWNQSATSTTIK